jgi:hypothetical protein
MGKVFWGSGLFVLVFIYLFLKLAHKNCPYLWSTMPVTLYNVQSRVNMSIFSAIISSL